MKKLKKIMSLILIVSLMITGMNVYTVKALAYASGNLNSAGTITWEISMDGVLTVSGKGTPKSYSSAADLPWNGYRDIITKVQINTDTDGIKNMSYWFYGCKNLTYINRFPDNVENLKYAFKGCTSLETVPIIPYTAVNMRGTFDGCTSLKSIAEYEAMSVKNWSYTYRNCTSLEFAFVTVPYPVTSIKEMFKGCKNLSAIFIFNGCSQLTKEETRGVFNGAAVENGKEIDVFSYSLSEEYINNLLDTTYNKVFYRGMIKNGKITYGMSKDGKSGYAYAYNTGHMCIAGNEKTNISSLLEKFTDKNDVKSINFLNGITCISDDAFSGFSYLENVAMPLSLKKIGNRSFKGCAGILHMTLPSELKSIGEEAFCDCSNMDTMYIPESVTDIGKDAFKGMRNDFYLECKSDSVKVQEYARENGIICRYPKSLSVRYKGNVTEGCKIDNAGFESIKLVYSDGTEIDIPVESIVIDDYEIVAGDNVLVARYGDFMTEFNVTGAEKSIVNITAVYDSEYGKCVEGAKIDTDAVSVVAEYDNGTKDFLKYGGITGDDESVSGAGYYTIDRYNLVISEDGSENIIVVRAGVTSGSPVTKTTTISIPAVKKSVIGISASYIGGDIVEGMGINMDNVEAYINFNNGTKERVLFSGEYNKYGFDIDTNYIVKDESVQINQSIPISETYTYSMDAYNIKKGVNKLIIWCSDMAAAFTVNGIEKSQTGITAGYDETVIEDDVLDMDKLDVYVTYNNGEIERIQDKTNILTSKNYKIVPGDNYVDVIYTDFFTGKEYRCSVYIKGVEKSPVEITRAVPVRTDIVEGEKYSDIEYNVTVMYDNGKEYDMIMKYNMAGYVNAGMNKVKITYKELEYDVQFEAGEFLPEIVTSVGTKAPDKLEKGTGIMLAITSNSASALAGKDINWNSKNPEIVKVSETGMATAVNYGETDITATVNGRTALYHVEVPMPEVIGISASYLNKILEDTDPDINDLEINLLLANGDIVKKENNDGVFFEEGYVIESGKNIVGVYYIDPQTSIKYECEVEIEGIGKTPVEILDIEPLRDDIIAGEPLYTLEFEANILYNNEKVYNQIITYQGKGLVKDGENTIIVSYNGVESKVVFYAGKFIPEIVMENGDNVPKEIHIDDIILLKVKSNSSAALENKPITWRSSDENVLKVDEGGKLEVIGGGTADITVYVNDETTKVTVRVVIPAKDLKIDDDNIIMSAGTTELIKYNIVPEESNEIITWVSKNTDIAEVSQAGEIKAKNTGTCKITGTTESGLVRELTITVKKEATNIGLNYSKVYIIKGKSMKLEYVIPSGMHTGSVVWSSGNKKIASVTANGKVVAKGVGSTVVTVISAGGKKAKCKIYVRKNPSKITLNKQYIKIKQGKTFKLKYSIPKNSYVSKVTWTTTDKKIVTVSSKGKIKAKKTGTAIVKVKTKNGKIAKCKVKVVKK